jgi:hypothetical protein
VLTVFLLCGLWHGANWTFVLWGGWHGAFLVMERLGLGRQLERLSAPARWAYTLLVVMGGWVLFRARNLLDARLFYAGLIGRHGVGFVSFDIHAALNTSVVLSLVAGCALASLPRWVRPPSLPPQLVASTDAAWTFGLIAVAMIYVAAGTYSPFLYFRF